MGRRRRKPVAGPGGWRRGEPGASAEGGGAAAPPLESAQFEAYYRLQGLCPEAEWPELLAALRSSLPAAVRVNGRAPVAPPLLAQLRRLEAGGGSAYAPRRLAWYPGGLAWQFDALSSREIGKDPQHVRLKARLVWLQGLGALTRQEAVSMIPPLFLDVKPEHSVLDLCAAPGSKASQLVELMRGGGSDGGDDDGDDDAWLRGTVVANEIDAQRTEVLTHMLNRLGSPTVVVVNLDARFFPNCMGAESEDGSGGLPLQFDRVLADVPCSGDGTLRKSAGLWAKWRPREALALHPRQYAILCRGLELLRPGGRLVYSTCSLNPVEDEAVVAAALRRYGGSVVLAEPPHLEGLEGRAGLPAWSVPHPEDGSTCWSRPEDVPAEVLPSLPLSSFAPVPTSADGRSWAGVCSRCRRFLPQDAQSGGFFAAVLEKVEEFPAVQGPRAHEAECPRQSFVGAGASHADVGLCAAAESEAVPCPSADATACEHIGRDQEELEGQKDVDDAGTAVEGDPGSGATARKRLTRRERRLARPLQRLCDYERVSSDDPSWRDAAAFFGLDPALAAELWRKQACGKRLYMASEGAARFLAARAPFRLRLLQAGVRVLERLGEGREGGPSTWRLAQEGLALLLRRGLRRRLALGPEALERLLERRELAPEELAAAGSLEALGSPPLSGSVAVTLAPAAGEPPGRAPRLAVAALLAGGRLELYVARAEAAALLESLRLLMAPAGAALPPEGAAAAEPGAPGAEEPGAEGAAAPKAGPCEAAEAVATAAAALGADALGHAPALCAPAATA